MGPGSGRSWRSRLRGFLPSRADAGRSARRGGHRARAEGGVSESAPNPDQTRSDANRDFLAQGIANVAAGLFRGQLVGGSVGQTALNRAFGARTRWAAIFSGFWMLLILLAFSGLVGLVAMPILAAVLIYAAVGSLRPGEVATIWRTGHVSKIAMVTTFAATLFLPVAAAVGVGVALSLVLHSGLAPPLLDQLRATRLVHLSEAIHPVAATEVLGASTQEALQAAKAWLVERRST